MFDFTTIQGFLDRVEDADTEQSALAFDAPVPDLAEQWQRAGIRPGDVALLCLPNGNALLQQFFAVLLSGGVPAIVGPHTPTARLAELAEIFGARAIASARPMHARDLTAPPVKIGRAHAHRCLSDRAPAAEVGEVILMTSGTSGFASGCIFDLSALLLNAERHAQAISQSADDTVLINLPLHFSFALVAQALASLVRGSRLVISGPPFHCPTYFRAISERGVTISSLTPVLIRPLLDGIAWPQRLRVLSVGGDFLAADQVEQLLHARPKGELYLTYGLTQAGPRVSTLAAHAEPAARHTSCGRPNGGTTVYLRDIEDGSGMKQLFVQSATILKRRIGLVEGRGQNTPVVDGVIPPAICISRDEYPTTSSAKARRSVSRRFGASPCAARE